MADIDDIIARAQRGGEFGKRRSFTLESSRAFKKMRQFALPDHHHFILELIQGAVANGAQYVDLRLEEDTLQLSYVGSGSGFTAAQLENLFEALFTSQSDESSADLRGLAMGINTLYALKFAKIIVESGDGTLEGSARMEIIDERISVGAPTQPLKGTFIVVHGGARRPVIEERLIIERCISSTIPIAVNGRFLFSTRGEKFPMPFGYGRALRFDEGDLYGTIGVNGLEREASFKIMVHGVHLWSFSFPELEDKQLGGIICFNRLRKTVDHADVNRDEVWAELWARLRPYADVVLGEKSHVIPSNIHVLSDPEPTPLKQAQARFEGAETLILVDPEASEIEKGRASIVADLLGGLPVAVSARLVSVVTYLVPRDVFVIAPSFKDASVMAFFNQDFAETPEGVGASRKLSSLQIGDFADHELSENYGSSLPGDRVQGTLYYSGGIHGARDGISVRFIAFGRVVWEGTIESTHRGVYLEVVLPSITPAQLERDFGALSLATRLVAEWDGRISSYLEDEFSLMLETGVEPLSSAAHIVLGRIESSFSLGFHLRGSKLAPSFRNWGKRGATLETLTIFKTLSGAKLGLVQLARMMKETSGLVYGVQVKDGSEEFQGFVDLKGLDRSQILLMDRITENALLTLVGEAGLVRVDQRDVLAEVEGVVLRDMALGLREYPADVLLAETVDGEVPAPEQVRAVQGQLLDALIGPVVELLETAQGDRLTRPKAEAAEWLRQATRHLQWAAVKGEEIQLPEAKLKQLRELPLFLTEDNACISYEAITKAHPQEKPLRFLEGMAQDIVQAALDSRSVPINGKPSRDLVFTTNPFVVELLKEYHPLSTALVYKRLRKVTPVDEGGAIVSSHVRNETQRGRIGVAPVGADASIEVTRPGKPTEWYSGVLRGLPMFGQFHLGPDDWFDEALEARRAHLFKLLMELPEKAKITEERRDAAVATLLHMTLPHIRWVPQEATAKLHVDNPEINQVLALPMLSLKTGGSTSPSRVLQTIEVSPQVDIALAPTTAPEVFDWVKVVRDRLWDVLVANRMRFENDRPTREKEGDYAGDLGRVYEIEGPPVPSVPSEKVQPTAADDYSGKLNEAYTASTETLAAPKHSAPPPKRPEPKAKQVDKWVMASKSRKRVDESTASLGSSSREVPKVAQRWDTFPQPPWTTGKVVVGVEENGTVHPKFVAWALTHWIDAYCPADRDHSLTSVHFRTMQRGAYGGVIERITPDFPDKVRWCEPPDDKTLRLGVQKYRSSAKDWVARAYAESKDEGKAMLAVVLNLNSDMVLTALKSEADLRRLFPILLLTAYSAANYRFTSIHAEHEEFFQEAVLERMISGEPFFETTKLTGAPDHQIPS